MRRRATRPAALVVPIALVALLAVVGGAAAPALADGPEGAALWEARCAPCHGSDGRGASGEAMFDRPMPDLTDCSFAAREADADWMAVTHQGGPARGFSELMPGFGSVLSEAELRAVVTYARSLCRDRRWPRGELNLPRPLVTEKAFPEDEAVVTTLANVNRDGDVTTELLFEKRIGPRGQVEISLPVVTREDPATGDWETGVGDLALGPKYAFWHDVELGSIASLGGEVVFPTGDETRGLGRGSFVFEPYLAAGQILPWNGFFQLQALGEIPVDPDLADEIQLRMALGTSVAPRRFGRVFSPMVEVVGSWAFADRVDEQWDLVPQVQVTLSRRQHLRLDLGVRIPLSDTSRRPTRVGGYLLWDWYDGGLFEGW